MLPRIPIKLARGRLEETQVPQSDAIDGQVGIRIRALRRRRGLRSRCSREDGSDGIGAVSELLMRDFADAIDEGHVHMRGMVADVAIEGKDGGLGC